MFRSNIKLIIAYDGTHYHGWQKTAMGPSIEGVLESTLSKILQEPVVLQAASRTDAGVHAANQVVNFFLNRSPCLRKLQYALNGLLPKEVRVKHMEIVHDHFHPTLDCIKKEYHYQVCYGPIQLPFQRCYAWHYPHDLNIDMMRAAAVQLIGRHDFSAFCNDLTQREYDHCIREIYTLDIFETPYQCLRFEICGNNFLYKMVRNLVGTIVYVGCGKIAVEDISSLISEKKRTQIGMTAPATGLFLQEVIYETKS